MMQVIIYIIIDCEIYDENVYFKFHEIIKILLLLPENIACNPRNVDLGK